MQPECEINCDGVSIDQMQETPYRSMRIQRTRISYLYARSWESQAYDVEGQDYLVFRYDDRTISFAVCDGVGQSFCGHLAAKFLGDALVDWLRQLDVAASIGELRSRVTGFLDELTDAGQQLILEHPLPEDLAPLTKVALEDLRAYGSETVFVGGRLGYHPGSADPSGDGQLLLCWLGDAELQVLDRKSRLIDVGANRITAERWSTTKGVKGAEQVHVWVGDTSKIGRMA